MNILGFDITRGNSPSVEAEIPTPIETEAIDAESVEAETPEIPTVGIDTLLQAISNYNTPGMSRSTFYTGEKYSGGFGLTSLYTQDYVILRQRSEQLFNENLYAKGLIRRLVTNEITTGLTLESTPIDQLLGLGDDFLTDWTEGVESRFQIWANNPRLCDYKGKLTFGELQRQARREALILGDVLVVIRQSPLTKSPQVELISASRVVTPMGQDVRRGNKIIHGVEVDKRGRQVAYWIRQEDGTGKRVAAFSERTGRRISWLEYGTDQRLDDVRGQPMLSIVLQSLKEIDRYRDSEQRAAVINSMVAMFIKKTEDKPSTQPVTGGAVLRDEAQLTNPDGTPRQFNITNSLPGSVMEELQTGEEPVSFDTTRPNVNFGVFESTIVYAIAWANEMPPEILTLSFQNNYSASRGAVNEFKMYLDKARSEFAAAFTAPVYIEWLLSEVLVGKIIAPGLLDAWRNPKSYDIFGAWISSDWCGAIKPNIDLKKEVDAYIKMIQAGLITRRRACRELTGLKYSQVVKILQGENSQLATALRPLFEISSEFAVETPSLGGDVMGASDDTLIMEATAEKVLEALESET